MSWFPLWPHIMLFLWENSSVLGWPLHISSTIPVWTLSGCRGPSDKDAGSGALLPSNGKRLPHTQRRSAPLRLPVRGQTGDQGTKQVGAKGERPPHWANWFNRWCRAGQVCRRTAVNRCKEDASVMDAKGCQLPPPGRGFGQNSTLLQVLLHYFQLICTNKHTHKEPDMVYRDKCGQCAEAQMVQPQWRCRAAFDGCEWLISGLAGSDRVTSGGAWQPQAHTRAFPPETRWSRNLQDAQQLLSRPYRSPIYSGYLLPLELDRFLSPASSFDGKAAESNGSFRVSQRATLDTKHAYFHFSSLHPFILSSG